MGPLTSFTRSLAAARPAGARNHEQRNAHPQADNLAHEEGPWDLADDQAVEHRDSDAQQDDGDYGLDEVLQRSPVDLVPHAGSSTTIFVRHPTTAGAKISCCGWRLAAISK